MDENQTNQNLESVQAGADNAGGQDVKNEIAALKMEFEALKKERDELKRQLNEQRGQALLKQAELEGKLTPAMVAEGSAYIEVAYNDADLFKRLMDVTPSKVASNRITIKEEMTDDDDSAGDDVALIAKAEKIQAEKNLDFAEALRLAHLED